MQYYTANIASLENEENTLNNSKNFNIEVIEEKSKILIITSTVHPDLGMLKKSIEANKLREVTIVHSSESNIDLINYQLLILYQPNDQFSEVLRSIEKDKLNFLLISGSNTDWSFLNENQSFVQKELVDDTENVQSVFNQDYPRFLIEDIGFSDFAPLKDIFGRVTFSSQQNVILFQKIGIIETQDPLLTTFENNGQKGAFLFGENTWRWRMNSFKERKSFEPFDGFISKLVQYLSSSFQGKRLNVSIEPMYYSNQLIQITANYLDANLQFDERAKMSIRLKKLSDKTSVETPFSLVNDRFYTELSNIEAGEYDYIISVENQTERVSGKMKIIPFDVEQQFSSSNDKALNELTRKTGGELHYNSISKSTLDQLADDPSSQTIQKQKTLKTPIIDWPWILGLLILLMSIEWFIRKYYGKI